MRVYGHYTNAPPFRNDIPLGSWHHLKTALSSTLGNANPHIRIKHFSKKNPNTPNAAHLGQNDASERPRVVQLYALSIIVQLYALNTITG